MDFIKGRLVRSKAGRDKTRTFSVLAVDGQMLLLVNGSSRPIANPKRKKMRHVAPTAAVLRQEDLASDEALSKAIAAFETQTRSEGGG